MTNAFLWLVIVLNGLGHLFNLKQPTWCSVLLVIFGLCGVALHCLEAIMRWSARREEERQDDPAERARWSSGHYRRRR